MSMAVAAAAMAGVQAVSSLRQGQQQAVGFISQAQGYEAQAEFKRFEGKQESLKFKAAAVNKLQEILENLARTNAVAGAGNVDAFSGSAEQNKVRGLNVGGLDLLTMKDNEEMSIMVANFQAEQLLFAGRQARAAAANAMSNARMNALFSLAQGAFTYAMLSTPGAPPGGVGATAGAAPAGGANLAGGFGTGAAGSFYPGGKAGTFQAIAM